MKDFTRRHVGMKIAAPKYIQRYFPEHAHKWQDSLDFVDTAGNITSWYDCNKFFESIPCSESKYSCKHGETRSKFPYPWLGVSLSRQKGLCETFLDGEPEATWGRLKNLAWRHCCQ